MSLLRVVSAQALPRFITPSVAMEIGLLLALSLMFPFMIHLLPVPEDTRLGPRLLPMFYAPLLGALLGRTGSAFAVAMVAPWLNWLLTRHPVPLVGVMMTLQLVIFVAALRLLLARIGARWFLAAPAYVGALAVGTLAALIEPRLIGGRAAFDWALHTAQTALPGVAILLAINWLVVRYHATGGTGGPRAA